MQSKNIKKSRSLIRNVSFETHYSTLNSRFTMSEVVNILDEGIDVYKVEDSGKRINRIIFVDIVSGLLQFYSEKFQYLGCINIQSIKALEPFWVDSTFKSKFSLNFNSIECGIKIIYDQFNINIVAKNYMENEIIRIGLRFLRTIGPYFENDNQLSKVTYERSDMLIFMNRYCEEFGKIYLNELQDILPKSFPISTVNKKNNPQRFFDYNEFEQISLDDNLCSCGKPNSTQKMTHTINNYYVYSAVNGHYFMKLSSPIDSFRELLFDGCRCFHLPLILQDETFVDLSPMDNLLFSDLLTMLIENAFVHSKNPLFIFLSFNEKYSVEQYDQLYSAITNQLESAIYIPEEKKLPTIDLLLDRFVFVTRENEYINKSQISILIVPFSKLDDNIVGGNSKMMECKLEDLPKLKNNKNYNELCLLMFPETSKNSYYNAWKGWMSGVGFVFWNFKIDGLCNNYYSSLFRETGGYLPKSEINFDQDHQMLTFTIISAMNLPLPHSERIASNILDPYCTIELVDLSKGKTDTSTETIINSNNPIFMESFSCYIKSSGSSFLRFSMFDADYIVNSFIGNVVVPVRILESGFQWLPLFDQYGKRIADCKIYVYLKIDAQNKKIGKFKRVINLLKKYNSSENNELKAPQISLQNLIDLLREFLNENVSLSLLCSNCISVYAECLDSLIRFCSDIELLSFDSDSGHQESCSKVSQFLNKFIEKYKIFFKNNPGHIYLKGTKNIPLLSKSFSLRNIKKDTTKKNLKEDSRIILKNELKYLRFSILANTETEQDSS